jgi:hypothetical protein
LQASERCVSGRCQLGLVSCASPADCPPGEACTSGVCIACTSDAACAALTDAEYPRCLDGQCVDGGLCFDGTQCGSGEHCVNGVCTPACDANTPCPAGYACDAFGTCDANPSPCGATTQPACGAGLTCVDSHCVTACAGQFDCGDGLVCVGGGCIPDQLPQITCFTEGKVGDGSPNECPVGRICINKICYTPCDADAGAVAGSGTGACGTADAGSDAGTSDTCRPVRTDWGDYDVCGAATSFGHDCNNSSGVFCDGTTVCIDGFCR